MSGYYHKIRASQRLVCWLYLAAALRYLARMPHLSPTARCYRGAAIVAGLAGLLEVGAPGVAHAELGSFPSLTAGLALSAGFQTDERRCQVAGANRNAPGTGCALLVGGIEGSFLWRGRIGGALLLSSTAGQASVPQAPQAGAEAPPAFPDRVSVVMALDVRPLGFLVRDGDRSYQARLAHGLRLGIGPSLEVVRTALDSSIAAGVRTRDLPASLIGMHALLDGELPLLSDMASALSLRISVRLLYAPQIVLNEGAVQSAPFEPTATPSHETQGYGLRTQLLFGFAYYL